MNNLYKSSAVGLGGVGAFATFAPCLQPAPCLQTAQNLHFRCNCQQNRGFWPPGAPDGLPTGLLAPKTASRRLSWRPRRPPDGPPSAQDSLPTGLLAPETAFRQGSWCPRRPSDRAPGAQDGLPTGLLAPKTAYRRASWRPRRPLHPSTGVCMTTSLTNDCQINSATD